jgi:hypothetical protein
MWRPVPVDGVEFAVVQEVAGVTTFLVWWMKREDGPWHHTLLRHHTGMATRSLKPHWVGWCESHRLVHG